MTEIVNILTFHHINPYNDVLTIPPLLFEKLLAEISGNYNFISYHKFKDFIFNDKRLPKKSILLTFDDGYLDNFIYAFPILKKYNIPAVIFIITENIKQSKTIRKGLVYFKSHRDLEKSSDSTFFINSCEMEEMENGGLVDIESHTVSHFICKNRNYEETYKELMKSYKFIRNYTKEKKFYGLCWPKGSFDNVALKVIKDSPYDFAFSTIDGAYYKGDNPYTIKRIDCSSWNGNEKDYCKRVKRKLYIYSNPMISKFYSNFREYRIRKKKEWGKK